MKQRTQLWLLMILLAMAIISGSTITRAQKPTSQFIGIFKAAHPELVTKGPTPEQLGALNEHVKYLQLLAGQGICVVAGHTLNHDETAFGLMIVRADSEAAARKIIDDDPLVRAGIVKVTLYPFDGLTGKSVQP